MSNQNTQNKPYMLGPGIRNICDKLINELNNALYKSAESKKDPNSKRLEFRASIKTNIYPYISKLRKILKNFEKIQVDNRTKQTIDKYYLDFNLICNQLDFLNKLSELYTFPKFDLQNSIDLIFNGCTNNFRQKLVNENLLNLIPSKNLYDNNDISFLINNDLNNANYNNEKDNNIIIDNNNNININNILLNKENSITISIIEYLNKKFDEFNYNLSLNDENNFKIFLDDNINIQIYNNFFIKIILAQKKLNNNKYFLLPIELSYNDEKININDKESIFIDKNKSLFRRDLQYFIDKFKSKIINKLNEQDFLEKCILFKDYTKQLFNEKFENLKEKLNNFIKKYDIPILIKENNISMDIDIDNNDENVRNNSELTIYYNFDLTIKDKNEFYLKLIYNKNYPTIIKMAFFQSKLINNNNNKNNQNNINDIPRIYTEPVEKIILFNFKEIKMQIQKCYNDYKKILIVWICKKLQYLYPIFFDFAFQLHNTEIIFGIKSGSNRNNISKKMFSIYINDLGKLNYNNLFTSKLFYDNFKEINSIIINYLKIKDNENEENEYLNKFNNYINQLIIEKMFCFQGTRTKLIELNDEKKEMILHLYNTYYTDKNISIYFEIKCQIDKDGGINHNYKNSFNIKEIKLIVLNNNNQNNKIILDCFDTKNPYLNRTIEFNSDYNSYLCKLVNDLNSKYELFMFYASDIIKLSEQKDSVFELTKSIEITNINNFKNKENEWYELSIYKNNMDIFKMDYKNNLLKYFYKIKFFKENNVFHFYLNPEIFKKKYSSILKIPIENYSIMLQDYILGYDYKEDFISIIILSKIKIGYVNIIELVFDTLLKRIISFMNSIFKLIDYLSQNVKCPVMTACPLLLSLQIEYIDNFRNINFKKHINFKIIDREPFYFTEGNYNNIFSNFVKEIGNEFINSEHDYNNKDYFIKKSKYFYLNYSMYDLFLNEFKFKYSLLTFPFNSFLHNNCNIYFMNKDFNILELISLKGIILAIQITPENKLFLEFRGNTIIDINGNNKNDEVNYLYYFNNEIRKKINFRYDIIEQNDNKKTTSIIIGDDNDNNESISIINKLRAIVNIFVDLSNSQ